MEVKCPILARLEGAHRGRLAGLAAGVGTPPEYTKTWGALVPWRNMSIQTSSPSIVLLQQKTPATKILAALPPEGATSVEPAAVARWLLAVGER